MTHRFWKSLLLGGVLAAPPACWAQSAAPGVLAREPTTPPEMFDAAVTLLKLSRPEQARLYLADLLAAQPDDTTLLDIRSKYGTALLLQMSRMETLQPEGQEILDRVVAAAETQLQDPAFQAAMVQDLTGDLRQREAAINVLSALGSDGVALVLGQIAKGVTPDKQDQLLQALVRIGPNAIAPTEGALLAPVESVRPVAAELLGRLDARDSLPLLMAAAFDPASPPALQTAARRAVARLEHGDPALESRVSDFRLMERLKAEALACFSGTTTRVMDDDGSVSIWAWDTAAGMPVQHFVTPTSAALYDGERAARAALRLSPDNTEAQSLLLGLLMWRDVYRTGWDQPIPEGAGTAQDLGLALGPALTQETLKLALAQKNHAAALVCLRVLSQTGSRATLLAEGSPLLQALSQGESRVQFAAANTVMQLAPNQPFPGAASVVTIFARALHSDDVAKVVVIDPNPERGSTLVGAMSNLGYSAGLAETGQEGFALAAESGNVELAILHLNTVRWDLTQTVANLRADPRTADLPIAVYGPPGLQHATRRKLRAYTQIGYVDDSGDSGLMQRQIVPLLAQSPVPPLTPAQRTEEMQAAAFWLRHISESELTHIFPLDSAESALSSAVNHPDVALNALVALGAIPTPAVQERLAEIALAPGFDASVRTAAAVQLAFHMQRFGRLVSNATADAIASAYQQETDPALQSSWAAVVGTLQSAPGAAARLLLSAPQMPQPLP